MIALLSWFASVSLNGQNKNHFSFISILVRTLIIACYESNLWLSRCTYLQVLPIQPKHCTVILILNCFEVTSFFWVKSIESKCVSGHLKVHTTEEEKTEDLSVMSHQTFWRAKQGGQNRGASPLLIFGSIKTCVFYNKHSIMD